MVFELTFFILTLYKIYFIHYNACMKIQELTQEEIINLFEEYGNINQILLKSGLSNKGSSMHRAFNKRIKEVGLDKLELNKKYYKRYTKNYVKYELSEILIENSKYQSIGRLKKRLLSEGLLEYKCTNCGIFEWNGKKLSLQIDHINGVSDDHRIENLRLLCPNCHSQTDTFTSKNKPKIELRHYKDKCECGNEKCNTSTTCRDCRNKKEKIEKRKVIRPDLETLIREIREIRYVNVAKKYGVSDNAVRKWIKSYGYNPSTLSPIKST